MSKSRINTINGKILIQGNKDEVGQNEILVSSKKNEEGENIVELYERENNGLLRKLNEPYAYKRAIFCKGSHWWEDTNPITNPLGINKRLCISKYKPSPLIVMPVFITGDEINRNIYLHIKVPNSTNEYKKIPVEVPEEDKNENGIYEISIIPLSSDPLNYKALGKRIKDGEYYFINNKCRAIIRNYECVKYDNIKTRCLYKLTFKIRPKLSPIISENKLADPTKLNNNRYKILYLQEHKNIK